MPRLASALLVFGVLCSGLTSITLDGATEVAEAVPGNPGVPGAPFLLYEEDFENSGDGTNTLLPQYASASGVTYTADPFWASRNLCNGLIVDATSQRVAGDCNGSQSDATGAAIFAALAPLTRALGVIGGAADPDRNGAASSYTSGSGADNQVQFQSSNLTSTTAGRFVTFSVDAVAVNCQATHPLLRFYLSDAGVVTPVSTSAIDPCTDPRSSDVAPSVRGGSFPANASTLMTSNQVGIILRNEQGSGSGNDGAYDNIRVLDVTPQLDKVFSPAEVPNGSTSTLTFTITNTSELAAKNGWSFTDALPAGLAIATPAATTSCPSTTVTAPAGATALSVTGNLSAGMTSCTVTVTVLPASTGVYTNGPDNVTQVGLNPPADTTLTVYDRDFGDAPDSYGTLSASSGATHRIVPGLMLGASIDAETNGQPSAAADGDGADEDGVAGPIQMVLGQTTTVTVAATNSTSEPATLVGWIDLDGDGAFEAAERVGVAVPAGTGTAGYELTFPAGTTTANTYARFRLLPGTVDPADVPPTGPAAAGEVEDYAVNVLIEPFVCAPNAPGLLFQHVSSPANVPPTTLRSVDMVTGAFQDTFTVLDRTINAVGYNVLDDYVYGWDLTAGEIVRVGADGATQGLGVPAGHVGTPRAIIGDVDENGHFWYALSTTGQWHQVDLNPGSPTYMTVLAQGVVTWPAGNDWSYVPGTDAVYSVGNVDGVSSLFSFDRGTKAFTNEGPLGVADSIASGAMYADADGFLYTSNNVNGEIYRIDVANVVAAKFADGPASSGNDGARCASAPMPIDFGDAPAGFGTLLSGDGPRHSIPGYDAATNTAPVMLGASIDIETDGQPNAASDGDGVDEDGVVFNPGSGYSTPTLVTGMWDPVGQQPVWNTLRMTASAAGFVSVWVDWNLDGDFLDDGERIANARAVSAGSNNVSFTQGTNPPGTQTYVRVRYSTDAASLASPAGAAPDGEVEDYRVLVDRVVHDFGDAPDAYGTTLGVNGAGHTVIPGLMIGSSIDDEADGQPSTLADGDDGNRIDDEDGVADPIVVTVGDLTTVVITATNTTADDAFLTGWIDLDANGSFDPGELNNASVTVPANSGTASYTLVFPAGTVTAETFARFRLAPPQGDIIMVDPVGHFYGGEVEDYPVTIVERELSVAKTSDATADSRPGDVVTYTVTATNTGTGDYTDAFPAIVVDDLSGVLDDASYNGDAAASAGAAPNFMSPSISWSGALAAGESVSVTYTVTLITGGDGVVRNVAFVPPCDPEDAECVVPPVECDPPTGEGLDPETGLPCDFVEIRLPRLAHTKVADTAVLSADGEVVTYTITVTNVGPGVFTDAEPGLLSDDLSAVLDDGVYNGDVLASSGATVFDAAGERLDWSGALGVDDSATITYSVTYDSESGDQVLLNEACVPVELAADPADPCRTVRVVGPALDDWKTVDPASGSTVRVGQEVTYTLHFENTGEAPALVDRDDVLTQILDDATVTAAPTSSDPVLTVSAIADGRFTVSGTLGAGQVVTVSYTVTVSPDGQRGDDRLGNFLVDRGTEPPTECVPADGERPDCTVNHVSNVVASKSSDPVSGAEVSQGQRVTYTLTFTNVSTNPDAAAAGVSYTDHLADVLDDAAVANGPVVSGAGVTAVRDGEKILVTGAVGSGETVTVSYTVTVHEYDRQGNHHLGNVLAVTGQSPVCVEGSGLCTSHDLVKPPALAHTGATIAWGVVLAALVLLLAGGGVVLISRRRRQEATR